ncbi:oligosaccharide repeat unit polymerase [cf. Phormidesmis sp. LEGE 11477]|uniref:oligosaccharide repeat unit polymerase n=1 Tax=cf. Phormidesmis sp. LEGE 11477 TaxID=1828680 RepID=UPI001880FD9B|nr:oligosaccharide repeat unit polymerase [cf. Phormidesmis sp. LEGE 11477]MBE9060262.1 oligosaccharide repeat unit polymerase [cf. Phormidesmis sp. LEGE 11477]
MTLSHDSEGIIYPPLPISLPIEEFLRPPSPSLAGTVCLVAGILIAYIFYPTQVTSDGIARVVAITVGIALAASFYLDSTSGLRNLLRTDALCLLALYGLTLAEFLLPQPGFNTMATYTQVGKAIEIVLVGMFCLALGRHFISPQPMRARWLTLKDISSKSLFRIFVASAFIAYFYMLLSVQFNIFTMLQAMVAPRFSQPWSRNALGGWSSLLTELNLLSYVIPPLAGIIWNRRRSFSKFQLLFVSLVFCLTIFHAFSSGTRNIFIVHIATFSVAYLLTLPKNTLWNTVLPICVLAFVAVFGCYHMLEFRQMGLKRYIANEVYASGATRDTFAVDYNLASIGQLADAIPSEHEFLGPEVIRWALIKPIPRAFWPGKPEGISVSIEEIAGAKGWTVAATYLGECYMMAGMAGVAAVSLFLGALAAWWNRMAVRSQSDYGLLVYALGFFAAGITMRSLFWLTTTILPVIALVVLRKMMPSR